MSRTLGKSSITELAERLEQAELDASEIAKITDDYPNMTMLDATDVQWEIRRRKESRGHKILGMKMGLTSWAKMKQMGVEKPCYGFLADYFALDNDAVIPIDELIHPKVEAELAFVSNKPLQGANLSIDEVLDATERVVPAVEVIDSRYKDFKFDLISVQADNSSSARFVIGGVAASPRDFDWRKVGVVMEKNGEIVEQGTGAAVLDNPAASVAMLAGMLDERDELIPAGSFIMTGGMTAAVLMERGDSCLVRYDGLGAVSMSFA